VEGERFSPEISPVMGTPELAYILKQNVPWAIAVGNEKLGLRRLLILFY
jgi:hypothetical protein